EIDRTPVCEIDGSFAVLRATATAVANVKRSGAVPLVFAGNCMTAVAACANPTTTRLGVIWLDAHGDFHTPETTHSGYLDGKALGAIAARSRIEALAFTAYDPSCDECGSGPEIVERALAAALTRAV